MPYAGHNDPGLPTNVKKLTEAERKQWVEVWNKSFENCMNPKVGGGPGDKAKCEQTAFRFANGVLKKEVAMPAEIKEEKAPEIGDKMGDMVDAPYKPYDGATSFEEMETCMENRMKMEEVGELMHQTRALVDNVLTSADEAADKPGKLQKIADGMRKRMSNMMKSAAEVISPGEKQAVKTEAVNTIEQVSNAISEFHGLMPEQKTQAIKQIAGAINKMDGTDEQKENLRRRLNRIKEADPIPQFSIMKAKDGSLRWIGIPSNKWRDRDNPPQIIEEAAHKEFVDYLGKTKDFPVLLSWHTPGTRLGVADWVDYSNGFLVMGGPIDQGKEKEAETLAGKCRSENIGMSHGFVYTYADKEREIIGHYRMWEVSHLPVSNAANVWTSIDILNKEVKNIMPFNAEKRKYLVDLHGEDVVKGLETKAASLEKDLLSAGVDFKALGTEPEKPPETGDAVKAFVESEGFKKLETGVAEVMTALKNFTEKSLPELAKRLEAVEKTAKEAADKAQKSHDDIIADALKARSSAVSGHRATERGEGLTDEEKKELGPEVPAIEPGMLSGFGLAK